MCWTQPQSFHCQQSNTDDTQSKCNKFTCELYARGGHYISSDASKEREGGFDFRCGFFFCAPHPSCFSPRAEFWAYTECGILYVFSNTKYFPFFGFMDMIKHQLSMFAYPGERVPESGSKTSHLSGKKALSVFQHSEAFVFPRVSFVACFCAMCFCLLSFYIIYVYIYMYLYTIAYIWLALRVRRF